LGGVAPGCLVGPESGAFCRYKRQSHFLSLAREKVTKERGTPAPRPTGILPSGSACGGGIFRQCIHALTKNGAHRARRPEGFTATARRFAGAPLEAAHPCAFEQQQEQQQTPVTCRSCLRFSSCAHDARALMGPHALRRRVAEIARRVADRMSAIVSPAHGCAVETTRRPERTLRTRMCAGRNALGCPSFWLLFVGHATKSDSAAFSGRNAL